MFNIAEAIFNLTGSVQNACARAKRLCERRILHSLCTNDSLMCKLTSKIYSEKPN